MRQVPPSKRTAVDGRGEGPGAGPGATSPVSPTVGGMVTAAMTLGLLIAGSLLLLIPAVFFLIPMPHEADAVTLCLPGVGPLQRFRDDLEGEHEELVFIHEQVHAAQCRAFGPVWYGRQALSPAGKLALEAPALCQEVAVLSRRGEDPDRLRERTVEILASGYLHRSGVSRREISAAVDRACGSSVGGGSSAGD